MSWMDDSARESIRAQLTARPKPKKKPNVHRRTTAGLWSKPFHSDALGVGVDQIEEATAALREHGVMADFDSQGRCIITSEKQFREVAKAAGLWDGRDGYGQKDGEGRRVLTGREREKAKQEFRRAVERGDYD